MVKLLRPPFIDIGSVGSGSPEQLEVMLQDVCVTTVDTARFIFPNPTERIAMTLLEVNPNNDPHLFIAAWDGYRDKDLESALFRGDVRLSNSMSGTVIKKREPVRLATVQEGTYYQLDPLVRSAMGAPVQYMDEIFGALVVESKIPDRFSEEDMALLDQIARNPGVALRLYRNSILNFRTGFYNTNFYERRMEREIAKSVREGTDLGLLLVDIDHLKEYNTAHGLAKGTWMIRNQAHAMQTVIPKSYPTARYGGDEFAVIMPDAPKEECLQLAEMIRRTVESQRIHHPKVPRNVRDYVTVSIGIGHSSDPFGVEHLEDTASFCVKAAKGDFFPRPKPGEDLDAFNRQRDLMVRNQVVGIMEYGTHLDTSNVYVTRHRGIQVLWSVYGKNAKL